jgi:hypothetical protein
MADVMVPVKIAHGYKLRGMRYEKGKTYDVSRPVKEELQKAGMLDKFEEADHKKQKSKPVITAKLVQHINAAKEKEDLAKMVEEAKNA